METLLHRCPCRCLPAVSRAGGHGWMCWGLSCRVSQVSSHLGNGSSQGSGKGRPVMACCQRGALDLVFWGGFLSCKCRPTCMSAFYVVCDHFIYRHAEDWHVGRHGCSPEVCPRLMSGLEQPGMCVRSCACLSLASILPLLGLQRAGGRRREAHAPAQTRVPAPVPRCSCRSWGCKQLSGPVWVAMALLVGLADTFSYTSPRGWRETRAPPFFSRTHFAEQGAHD